MLWEVTFAQEYIHTHTHTSIISSSYILHLRVNRVIRTFYTKKNRTNLTMIRPAHTHTHSIRAVEKWAGRSRAQSGSDTSCGYSCVCEREKRKKQESSCIGAGPRVVDVWRGRLRSAALPTVRLSLSLRYFINTFANYFPVCAWCGFGRVAGFENGYFVWFGRAVIYICN